VIYYLLIALYSLPFWAWIGFQVLPNENTLVYTTFLCSGLISTLSVYFYLNKDMPKTKNSLNIRIASFVLLIPILALLIYSTFFRWTIEPHGFGDSVVLWNQKAQSLFLDFTNSNRVRLYNTNWKFPTYPTGLPLSLASMAIVFGKWSLEISYLYNTLVLLLLVGTLAHFIANYINQENTKIRMVLIFILLSAWLLEFNTRMIYSDLCADFSLLLGVSSLVYLYLSPLDKGKLFLWGLTISWMFSLKNEGVFYIIFALILFSAKYFSLESKISKKALFFFVLIVLFFSFPQILHKIQFGFLNSDFTKNPNVSNLDKILDNSRYMLILGYFFKFQFLFHVGIPFLGTIFLIFKNSNKPRSILLTVYWFATLLYCVPYLFTDLDLDFHLHTSYFRINTPLQAFFYMSILDYLLKEKLIFTPMPEFDS
jgi:hypothetical protein